ncbi:type IV pilus biogenesis/stability protein PilW [Rheinheimera riviphila]|uniref:Type IV pilus biogenesis/stability protein PilW n=1 Tax=Rheinheimera riviphila TaxID=1834037 RepID=A0A437R510_9GAMM|nr:type IV pilus biogenesis/stability protein PilW [Rheinheimera riviphila]RVU41813.1 type IV pilus biogenesis/stability protein PilW [Rheinheimera riviphila]
MQNKLVVASVFCLTLLSGCVSESTVVDTDRVGSPRTDMKEAARTRMSLGLNYLQRGDTSQAKYNLEKAKQLAPDMSDVDNALAYYFQQVGELDQAEDAYRASLRKDSNNADTYNNFGSFLCQINKYTEAEELLQAAIKRPGYIRVADSYENLAFCALAQKDYLRYQQFLRQSLQHNSNRTSSLYNMAVIEYAMGNLTEAKKWQARLHQMGQVSPEATLIRYLVAYHSGDAVEQQTAEKFLLSVYPGSSEAAMLLSSDFSQSKPEQMKQAYKATLLTTPADQVDMPDKPKMKIVKRKSSSAGAAATSLAVAAAPVPTFASQVTETAEQQRPRDEMSDLPAEAENLQTSSEVTAALTPVATLPEEQPTTAVVLPTESAATGEISEPEVAATNTATVADDVASQAQSSLPDPEQVAQTEAAASTEVLTHKVGAGDTLYNIASRYRLSVPELQELNQLDDAALIVMGQELRLSAAADAVQSGPKKSQLANSTEPAPASYQVADGESWFSISYKYNIKLDTLLKWNNMTADQPLSIGQTIYLRDPALPSL